MGKCLYEHSKLFEVEKLTRDRSVGREAVNALRAW